MSEHLSHVAEVVTGIAFVEVLAKPVVVRYSRKLLELVDSRVKWIPDWLHRRCEHED